MDFVLLQIATLLLLGSPLCRGMVTRCASEPSDAELLSQYAQYVSQDTHETLYQTEPLNYQTENSIPTPIPSAEGNSGSNLVRGKAICPWSYGESTNSDLFPRTVSQAISEASGTCVGVHNDVRLSSSCKCVPITMAIRVLKKKSGACQDMNYVYEPAWQTINIGYAAQL